MARALILGERSPVLNVNETLCVRVAEVGLVREAQVDLSLIERVFDLVWIYAGREAGYNLLYFEIVRSVQDIVVDENVVPQKVELLEPILISEQGWQSRIRPERDAPSGPCLRTDHQLECGDKLIFQSRTRRDTTVKRTERGKVDNMGRLVLFKQLLGLLLVPAGRFAPLAPSAAARALTSGPPPKSQ